MNELWQKLPDPGVVFSSKRIKWQNFSCLQMCKYCSIVESIEKLPSTSCPATTCSVCAGD